MKVTDIEDLDELLWKIKANVHIGLIQTYDIELSSPLIDLDCELDTYIITLLFRVAFPHLGTGTMAGSSITINLSDVDNLNDLDRAAEIWGDYTTNQIMDIVKPNRRNSDEE